MLQLSLQKNVAGTLTRYSFLRLEYKCKLQHFKFAHLKFHNYNMENIIKERKLKNGKKQFLFSYKGYPQSFNEWISEDQLAGI